MPKIDLTQESPGRYLIYGPSASGKTTAWLDFLRQKVRSGFKGKFHVIDVDDGTHRNVSKDIGVLKPHLEYYIPANYGEFLRDFQTVVSEAKPGDVVVVEMLGALWNGAQDHYIRTVEDEELVSEVLLEKKRAAKEAGKDNKPTTAASGDIGGWSLINKLFEGDFAERLKLLPRTKGVTVIATAESDPIQTEGKFADNAQTMELFGPVGFKPATQKRTPYRFDYIVFLSNENGKRRTFVPVKIRDDQHAADGFLFEKFAVDKDVGVIESFNDMLKMNTT